MGKRLEKKARSLIYIPTDKEKNNTGYTVYRGFDAPSCTMRCVYRVLKWW